MPKLLYSDRVVVVTGAGNGLGRQYALWFASRGARVVVNDLGGSFDGAGKGDVRVADGVVQEIRKAGGIALANYDAVQNGDRIIDAAVQAFGRVDVVINNAGILRDITLRNMKDQDWDIIMDVHVHGSMKTVRAAWPHFKKQKYGRIINTSSASGLFANFGQSNYAAAKMAVVGLTKTLAKEGAKHNIHSNVLAPAAGSRLTQTVWPPEMMDAMKPDFVVPLVGLLAHHTCQENGSIFEAGAGHYSKIRWERSRGFMTRPDATLTPDSVLRNHDKIIDFTNAEHPTGSMDLIDKFEQARQLPKAIGGDRLTLAFQGRVALVTGGGAGLGRAYALALAAAGATVIVNDIQNAEKVADEIIAARGKAVAINISVEQGEDVVKWIVKNHGRIDIIVNNAGILRDKAFQNMTEEMWFAVYNVHLRATYKVCKAAWPYMTKQKYGRIVNITSTSGIYGNFGQSNYATAKAGIIAFTRVIAREGAKYNIIANVVGPSAGTNMTRTVWPEDQVRVVRPEYVAPLVVALCSIKPPATAQIYEAGAGCFAATRLQRARGYDFDYEQGVPEAEALRDVFHEICNFDNGEADNPDVPGDGGKWTMGNALRSPRVARAMSMEDRGNRQYISRIQEALKRTGEPSTYTYTSRDVIMYNLGLGAKHADLPLVYEGSKNFHALPTFAVIPTYHSKAPYELKDILPNFDYRLLLHGEQYLELKQFPIPTSGTLRTTQRLIEVVDKGNAAIIRRGITTQDSAGRDVSYCESVSFIRKAGGFGGQRKPTERGAATAPNIAPSRIPDKVVEEQTSMDLAAIYRLSGDYNPLHIDPDSAAVGGFKDPILHGLATFGITGKHVYQTYGPYKNIKVRFSGTVVPGQTIVTEMWKDGRRIIYRAKVKETGKSCISNAAVELMSGTSNL